MTYRGYGYDRIMINVDKAMNNMALGRTDAVRTEIVRLDASQQACERRYAKQIEELRKAQSDSKNVDSDPKKVGQDPKFQEGQAKIFEDFTDDSTLSTPLDDERYKYEYTNPFAEYLKSIFYSYSNEPGEAEQARVAMRHAAAMAPHNSFVTKDLDEVEFAANSEKVAPKTYVFFETGMAPTRKEIRIDLPIFIVNLAVKDTKVDYVGVAFPQLKRDDDFHRYLIASTTDANYKTETLADMDRIIAREFKHEMPVIITRLVVSQGLKVAAEVGTAEAVKNQNPLVQVASRFSVSAFNAATNEADLRTWHTLPKQIQIADFNTPANGIVRLALPNGASAGTVNVRPGKANVIWIVNASTQSQPTVRTFALE